MLHPEIRSLPVQSYSPRELADQPAFVHGDRELWLHLPEALKKHPARIIESLPNYRRPALVAWLEQQGRASSDMLTIGDLLDLGFDPTRLKELTLGNEDYIFERIQAHLITEIIRKNAILQQLIPLAQQVTIKNARVHTNPVLLVIRDRGNAYVLRSKVSGIHWEEAVDQLQSSPSLQALNTSMRLAWISSSWLRCAREPNGSGPPWQMTGKPW